MTKATKQAEAGHTAEFIFAALRALPGPKNALEALAAVNCAMCIALQQPGRPMTDIQIRVMMGEMTDAVVKIWQSQQPGTIQ